MIYTTRQQSFLLDVDQGVGGGGGGGGGGGRGWGQRNMQFKHVLFSRPYTENPFASVSIRGHYTILLPSVTAVCLPEGRYYLHD